MKKTKRAKLNTSQAAKSKKVSEKVDLSNLETSVNNNESKQRVLSNRRDDPWDKSLSIRYLYSSNTDRLKDYKTNSSKKANKSLNLEKTMDSKPFLNISTFVRVTEDGKLEYITPSTEENRKPQNRLEQLKLGRLNMAITPITQYRTKFGTNFTSKITNTKASRLSSTPAHIDLPNIKKEENTLPGITKKRDTRRENKSINNSFINPQKVRNNPRSINSSATSGKRTPHKVSFSNK